MRQDTLIIDTELDGRVSRYVLGPLAGLELPRYVAAPPPVWVVDRRVADLHGVWIKELQAACSLPGSAQGRTFVVDGGEGAKTTARLEELWTWLAALEVPRDATLVAVGGGCVLDLAGFAAATWRRGISCVLVPTTLLAMVDAAVGGKTAINAAGLKNPVGAFHPARAILADRGFLATLARREWRQGMAEMIKTAVIGEPRLFADLWSHRSDLRDWLVADEPDTAIPHVVGALPWRDWIARAVRVKADLVTRDFREQGPRRALNLGHSLGHALEAWHAGRRESLNHGDAVSIGLAAACRVAAERDLCPLGAALKIIELLVSCGLPVRCPAPPAAELERLLRGDKKATARGGLRWVLPRRIGEVDVDVRVETAEILKWLD